MNRWGLSQESLLLEVNRLRILSSYRQRRIRNLTAQRDMWRQRCRDAEWAARR